MELLQDVLETDMASQRRGFCNSPLRDSTSLYIYGATRKSGSRIFKSIPMVTIVHDGCVVFTISKIQSRKIIAQVLPQSRCTATVSQVGYPTLCLKTCLLEVITLHLLL